MSNSSNFQPNWASKPGDTIADILSERKISVPTFADKMNSSTDYIHSLLAGYVGLTKDLCSKLEVVLGPSADFWLRREIQYRESLARLKQIEENWIKELPIKEMVNWGWLKLDVNNKIDSCLQYFGVSSVNAWQTKYQTEIAMVNFRTSPAYKPQPAAVAAWLRQGEIQSEKINCNPWNAKLFKEKLVHIKKLTRIKNPGEFLPQLIDLCADCGVAVVIARTPSGCQASGVTKFIQPDRALLMLSFRYLTDDHFWFTFFHEAGHLLLHGNKSVFVEEIGKDKVLSTQEIEANDFAAEQLIPAELRIQLMRVAFTNKRSVVSFAALAGISPGIVIGQLQHIGKIEYSKMNSYKRRYSWDDIAPINH